MDTWSGAPTWCRARGSACESRSRFTWNLDLDSQADTSQVRVRRHPEEAHGQRLLEVNWTGPPGGDQGGSRTSQQASGSTRITTETHQLLRVEKLKPQQAKTESRLCCGSHQGTMWMWNPEQQVTGWSQDEVELQVRSITAIAGAPLITLSGNFSM
ncbi:unnamed protein product [Pleuronectes platessa]|uniref:Uncharacterized protein n=1 Tax=Pleuronectes platessa TaxID=8262 RepID=A0A9N7W1M2_PLEPL|nr:unnamed protein product [Pleuronectes platessa]